MFKLENNLLKVSFEEKEGRLSVLDKRINYSWEQTSFIGFNFKKALTKDLNLKIEFDWYLYDFVKAFPLVLNLGLAKDSADLRVELRSSRDQTFNELPYPYSFILEEVEGFLVLPHCEGILIPVKDFSFFDNKFNVYQNAGLSMPWFGATDLNKGYLAIFETPDDALVQLRRLPYNGSSINVLFPVWRSSKGKLIYPRKLLYHFFNKGGYVEMAKYYRSYAMRKGLFKSLKEKAKENPNVAKLIGAADYWTIGPSGRIKAEEALKICSQLNKAGINKVLVNFSYWAEEEDVRQILQKINKIGYLTGRYDQYVDVYPQLQFDLRKFPQAYPKDILKLSDGALKENWFRTGRKGLGWSYFLCSIPALEIAKKLISKNLAKNPYAARFLDIATAATFCECFDPEHPMTRSIDKEYRYKLLEYTSSLGLLVGSEHGADWAIPVAHYFEGMMSLWGPRYDWLLPGGGYDLLLPVPPTQDYLKYNLGEYLRVPLFELVYHDAVLTTWYWGDTSNRIPELWHKKDLFNILYGTMPMWMFDEGLYLKYKQHFLKSYRDVCKFIEKIACEEMVSHEFLTEDHTVQKSQFSSGRGVIVNFGPKEFITSKGKKVPAFEFLEISA